MAHGGFQKNIGKTQVFINLSPISPLVGENVKMTFQFLDLDYKSLPGLDVTLTLVDTFYGDESKDKTILTKNFKTDINGAFDFDYTFTKENYFDINFTFKEPSTGKEQETGFLIQARNPQKNKVLQEIGLVLTGLVLGFCLSMGVNKKIFPAYT